METGDWGTPFTGSIGIHVAGSIQSVASGLGTLVIAAVKNNRHTMGPIKLALSVSTRPTATSLGVGEDMGDEV